MWFMSDYVLKKEKKEKVVLLSVFHLVYGPYKNLQFSENCKFKFENIPCNEHSCACGVSGLLL